MEALKGVVSVTADELQTMDTSSTPAFLGLTAAGGLWQQLGGQANGSAGDKNAAGPGEGIVIGVVDSGVWPENPSFSDRGQRKAASSCTSRSRAGMPSARLARTSTRSMCNQKLIGAQCFNAGLGRRRGRGGSPPVGVHVAA